MSTTDQDTSTNPRGIKTSTSEAPVQARAQAQSDEDQEDCANRNIFFKDMKKMQVETLSPSFLSTQTKFSFQFYCFIFKCCVGLLSLKSTEECLAKGPDMKQSVWK